MKHNASDQFELDFMHIMGKLYWFERSVTYNSEFRFAGHLADWKFEQIMTTLVQSGKSEVIAIGSHEIMTVDRNRKVDHWKQMPPRLEDVASIKALRR